MKAPYCEGPIESKICFVGEAPGECEVRDSRPFVGPAGDVLNELLSSASILRTECRLENVMQVRPPGNAISRYIDLSKKTPIHKEGYDESVLALKERLEACSFNVLVPLGNVPLYALTGRRGILRQRGSILESTLLPGKKVIPTIHPSATIARREEDFWRSGQYLYRYFIVHDLMFVREQSEFPDIILRERKLYTNPTVEQACEYIKSCHKLPVVAMDIEVMGYEVSHISVARSPNVSMCIPFVEGIKDNYSPPQETEIWYMLAKLFEDENVVKIGHNMTFDASFLLNKYGIKVRPIEDTMVAFGTAFPDFPKRLDFLQSLYCKGEPYYKDERKKHTKNPFTSEERFRLYNAKDSAIPMEIYPEIRNDLGRLGNLSTYYWQRKLIEPLIYMQERGILMDVAELNRRSIAIGEAIKGREAELALTIGDINIRSSKQLMEHFYIRKGIKPYLKNGRPTLDKTAMVRLSRRGYKEAQTILELRRLYKRKGTYYDVVLDDDNRLRCFFNPITKSGRLSSSKTIFDTGANLQNQPDDVKQCMIADPGCLFIQLDLAQAENRTVAYIAGEARLINAFENNMDVHRQTAGLIFGKDTDDVSDESGSSLIGDGTHSERFWGKKANHAINYGLTYKGFALDNEIPEKEAKLIIEAVHYIYPGIRQWQASIRDKLAADRILTTPFGRSRKFYEPWGQKLWRSAYSFIPQSVVAYIINRYGICFVYYHEKFFKDFELLNQVHDSIVIQYELDRSVRTLANELLILIASLKQTIEYKDRKFSIPADLSVGYNLGKYREAKNPKGLKGLKGFKDANQLYELIMSVSDKQTRTS